MSDWTVATLKEHLEARLKADRELADERHSSSQTAMSAALAAAKEAVLKSESASEKRFESVNEFRGALDANQRTLFPRAEADLALKNINDKIDQINKAANDKIDLLAKAADARTAQRSGVSMGWAAAIGVIGLVGMAAGAYAMLKH